MVDEKTDYTDITVGPKLTFSREGMTIEVDAQTTVPHRTFLSWEDIEEQRGRLRHVKFWNKQWPWRKADGVVR